MIYTASDGGHIAVFSIDSYGDLTPAATSAAVGVSAFDGVAFNTPGVAISLVDAPRFYDAQKITQRPNHLHPRDNSAPYFRCWQAMNAPNLGGARVDAPRVFGYSW